MPVIVIDAGHGGRDPGAVFEGRQEKDDTLRLALAVGTLLRRAGMNVIYTRTEDVYDTPYQKAVIANNNNADYLVSIHRNAMPIPGSASGIEALVYADRGVPAAMARAINKNLEAVGFRNRGVIERPNLAILRRSAMPAVLVETGFIDNPMDNRMFDEDFDAIAEAIADGILDTVGTDDSIETARQISLEYAADSALTAETAAPSAPAPCSPFVSSSSNAVPSAASQMANTVPKTTASPPPLCGSPAVPDDAPPEQMPRLYRVQVGAFRDQNRAYQFSDMLTQDGFPSFIVLDGDLYKVQVGAFARLENAVRMEYRLRAAGYDTYITT